MSFPFGGAGFHLLLSSRCKLGAWFEAPLKFSVFFQPVRVGSPDSGAAGCSISFKRQYFVCVKAMLRCIIMNLSIPF